MKGSSAGLNSSGLIKILKDRLHSFYDYFNRAGEDTDVWTSGGDAGGFTDAQTSQKGTCWQIYTGNVTDNDRYIHGDGVINNIYASPWEEGYTTVTFSARIHLVSIADISVFLGLLEVPITDYAEPASRCVHFLIDPAVSATFRARSYSAAEEETDTLVALDTATHTFKFVWTRTLITFYIDGVEVASHATQVPTTAQTPEILLRTEANAVKYLRIEEISVEVS